MIAVENLIEGQPYMVKHYKGEKAVRRIFRGTEKRFGDIDCFVFSSKVKKGVFAEVEHAGNGVRFFKWKNTQTVPRQEVSIPFYDLIQATPIN